MANFDLVPLALYEVSHEQHERGYSLHEILQCFKNESLEHSKFQLDQVIDVPFVQDRKMGKVEAPVVPIVRATSYDSLDSLRMA
jgi:hypothetical protein